MYHSLIKCREIFLIRYDSSVVELMKWYEAIFGESIWNHMVIETSFWKHSEEESAKRLINRKVIRSIGIQFINKLKI